MKKEYVLRAFCKKCIDDKYYIFPKKRIGNGMSELEINETGSDILSLLQKKDTVVDVINGVLELYELTDDYYNDIENDVYEFMLSLKEYGILDFSEDCCKGKKVDLEKKEDGLLRIAQLQELYAERLLPYKFFIELTYNCNLMCKHCYKTKDVGKAKKNPEYLSKEIIFPILDELENLGVLEVYFTGGEMFLNPDVYDIIQYASTKNFMTILLTNGNLISKNSIINKLKGLDLFDIRISVYGNENTHDNFTRVKGSYNKAMQALKKLNKELGIGTAVYVVTNDNFEARKDFISLMESEGINYSINTHLTPTSDGELFPLGYRISKEQFSKLCQEINMPLNGTSCSAGLSRFRITPTGDVNPCELIRGASFGNVHEKSIGDILGGEERLLFIERYKTAVSKYPCAKCNKQNSCNFCPAAFFLETRAPGKVPQYACDIAQVKYDMKENVYI